MGEVAHDQIPGQILTVLVGAQWLQLFWFCWPQAVVPHLVPSSGLLLQCELLCSFFFQLNWFIQFFFLKKLCIPLLFMCSFNLLLCTFSPLFFINKVSFIRSCPFISFELSYGCLSLQKVYLLCPTPNGPLLGPHPVDSYLFLYYLYSVVFILINIIYLF